MTSRGRRIDQSSNYQTNITLLPIVFVMVFVQMTMVRHAVVTSFIAGVVFQNCCTVTHGYLPALRTQTNAVSSKHDNTKIGLGMNLVGISRTSPAKAAVATPLHMIANLPSDDGSGLSYAERSRPYRRDVFDSDEWVRVRNTARFSKNLLSIFQSGIVRQLLNEAIFIAGAATFLCLYNALLVTGYDDLSGIHHDPFGQGFYVFKLPSIFFTLTSPALSLLLGK